MITTAILGAVVLLLTGLLSLIPDVTLPEVLTGTGAGTLQGAAVAAGDAMADFSNWLPTSTVAVCLPLIGGAYVVAASVWIVRRVLSLVTGGGGS